MSKIIYTNPDNGIVIVVHPTGATPIEDLPAKRGLTDYEIVDDDVIPTDRTFRNAWVKSGATIVEDLPKSKESHMSVVVPLVKKSLDFMMK